MKRGSKHGFTEGAPLIFTAKTKSGDYHDNMKQENFEKWFKEQSISTLPGPSLIKMDNATYHSRHIVVTEFKSKFSR